MASDEGEWGVKEHKPALHLGSLSTPKPPRSERNREDHRWRGFGAPEISRKDSSIALETCKNQDQEEHASKTTRGQPEEQAFRPEKNVAG